MKINDLIPMQEGLRASVPLDDMVAFVKKGGIYTPDVIAKFDDNPKPIVLVKFEDDKMYIHDGHHRIASIWLSGTRDWLDEKEYIVKECTYERYRRPNFELGFVTPFDPKTEVRVNDFAEFKKYVLKMGVNFATVYISENRHLYCMPREPRHFGMGWWNKLPAINNGAKYLLNKYGTYLACVKKWLHGDLHKEEEECLGDLLARSPIPETTLMTAAKEALSLDNEYIGRYMSKK